MALLGTGLLGIWHDLEVKDNAELSDFQLWYTRQHLPERLGVPGFLRGRRYQAVAGQPQYAALYETKSVETLASASYHKQLNNPTTWSTQNLARFRNTNRTAFTVEQSLGYGIGAGLSVIWLSPENKTDSQITSWITDNSFPHIIQTPGIVGAHLLTGDQKSTHADTTESEIRGTPDKVSDWVVLVEGHDPSITEQALSQYLSPTTIANIGNSSYECCHYKLIHSSVSTDILNF